MTTIYTLAAILLAVAMVYGVRNLRRMGEPIRPHVVRIVEPERPPVGKPAPTIVNMSRREPMRKRKTRKRERKWRGWDAYEQSEG